MFSQHCRHGVDFGRILKSVQDDPIRVCLASSQRMNATDSKCSSKSSLSDEKSNFGFFEAKWINFVRPGGCQSEVVYFSPNPTLALGDVRESTSEHGKEHSLTNSSFSEHDSPCQGRSCPEHAEPAWPSWRRFSSHSKKCSAWSNLCSFGFVSSNDCHRCNN